MILDCYGGSYELSSYERDYFAVVGLLMIAFVPATIGYALWRIFVTNRTGLGGTTVLGLDQNSATYREVYDHGMSWRRLFLYGLTGFVFGFEVFRYFADLMLG